MTFRDIALALIKSKQWKKTLRNTTVNQFGNCTTPLRKLIKKMPGEFQTYCIDNMVFPNSLGFKIEICL